MFFELDGYTQADLDKFAELSGTSRFTPVLDTSMPGKVEGETDMDLQVVHAIVPDAKLVVYNISTAWSGTSAADYIEHIAASYRQVEQKYPGSVWSISIGTACEALFRPTDLVPLESALEQATAHGTSVFMSTGDSGGLECKAARTGSYGAPPSSRTSASARSTARRASPPPAAPSSTRTRTAGGSRKRRGASSPRSRARAAVRASTSPGRVGRPVRRRRGQRLQHRLTPDVSADADPIHGAEDRRQRRHAAGRRHVPVGADLGGADGADEPVPRGERRQGARPDQSAALQGGGVDPERVPRCDARRQPAVRGR